MRWAMGALAGEGVTGRIFRAFLVPPELLKEDPTARKLRKCHRAATNESIPSYPGCGTSRRLARRRLVRGRRGGRFVRRRGCPRGGRSRLSESPAPEGELM